MSFSPVPNDQAPDPTAYVFPNDGDPLVVASVNQALQDLVDNAAFSQLKTRTVANVRNFGAVGNGSTDDLAAFNAATAAIVAGTGGGVLLVPPGFYRLSDALVLPGSVSIVGVGHPSLLVDHATAHLLTFSPTGLSPAPAVVCRGLLFGVGPGTASNTGTVLHDGGGRVRVLVQDCSMAPVGLDGQLIAQSAHTSSWTLTDCYLYHGATTNVFIDSQDPGYLYMDRCVVVMPASGSHIGVRYVQSRGGVHNCTFDFSAHTTSAGSDQIGILANSDFIACGGNSFVNLPAIGRTPVLADYQVAGYRWNFSQNSSVGPDSYAGVFLPYGGKVPLDGSGTADVPCGLGGTVVGPSEWFWETADPVSPIIYCPSGYDTYTLKVTNSSAGPIVSLPAVTSPGDKITVYILNFESGYDWTRINFQVGAVELPGWTDVAVSGDSVIGTCVTSWAAVYDYTNSVWRWALVAPPVAGT